MAARSKVLAAILQAPMKESRTREMELKDKEIYTQISDTRIPQNGKKEERGKFERKRTKKRKREKKIQI